MSKFSGKIGFVDLVETAPSVYEEVSTEIQYRGDLVRNSRKLQSGDQVNADISLSNEISIIANPYALNNFYKIRYVTFMGSKWKVTSVDVKHPRLILSIGGLYNGK